jgi:hypothetical protein
VLVNIGLEGVVVDEGGLGLVGPVIGRAGGDGTKTLEDEGVDLPA